MFESLSFLFFGQSDFGIASLRSEVATPEVLRAHELASWQDGATGDGRRGDSRRLKRARERERTRVLGDLSGLRCRPLSALAATGHVQS